jgi:hypothetical protein
VNKRQAILILEDKSILTIILPEHPASVFGRNRVAEWQYLSKNVSSELP